MRGVHTRFFSVNHYNLVQNRYFKNIDLQIMCPMKILISVSKMKNPFTIISYLVNNLYKHGDILKSKFEQISFQ